MIGFVFALHIGNLVPISVSGYLLLFAGGLVAGLFTRGPVTKGALAGAVIGCLVVAVMVMMVSGTMGPVGAIRPVWISLGVFAFIIGVFFIPSNTVSGIIGAVIRKWYLKEPLLTAEIPGGHPVNQRTRWAAIIAGAFVVAGSSFLVGSLSLLLVIPPLAAGFLAGSFSAGRARTGFESGLITGILGVGILAVPVLLVASQGGGFAAGLAGIVLVIDAIVGVPCAVAGGIIGAVGRERISRYRSHEGNRG